MKQKVNFSVIVVSYLCSVGQADAMQAVELATGLAARHHPRLHVAPGEVLQLVVDVEVPNAAVETGHVEDLRGETQRGGHHLLRHPWRNRRQSGTFLRRAPVS